MSAVHYVVQYTDGRGTRRVNRLFMMPLPLRDTLPEQARRLSEALTTKLRRPVKVVVWNRWHPDLIDPWALAKECKRS